MSKSLSFYRITFLLACIISSLSCSWLSPPPTPEIEIAPADTATSLPAPAPASPSPEPTLLPTETPFPSPTPIPWPAQPITQENVKELEEINRWGRGSPLGIEKLQRSDEEFLVLTDFGVYLYRTTPPSVLAFLPDANQVILSEDEHLLAVGLKNGDVQIWNMDDMSLQQTFTHMFPEDIVRKIEEHMLIPFYVGGMAFSPDSSEIAVGYADGTIELRRLGEEAPYAALRHDSFGLWQTDIGLAFELSYSADSKVLTVFKYEPYVNANRLTFWSLPEGELISVSEAGRFHQFAEPAYLTDEQTLLVFTRHDSYLYLTLWDVRTGAKLTRFDTDLVEIISTELAQDGSELTIYGWDAQPVYYRQVRKLPEGDLIESEKLAEHPETEYLARTIEFLFEQGHYYNSWGDVEHPTSARLTVTGDRTFRVHGEAYWIMFPEEMREPIELPEGALNPYYDPEEQTLGWCTAGKLHFLDKNGETVTTDLPFITNCDVVTVSPQRHYAAVSYGKSLYLVNLETGKFNKLSFDKWWQDITLAARFSRDEEILITSLPALITVWQVEPPQKLADSRRIRAYVGHNTKVVISKDKSFAVTLNAGTRIESDQSQIIVWRVADAFTLQRINPPFIGGVQPEFASFALSPDEELIASGDNFGGIRIWSVKSGEEIAYFDLGALPLDLAFTPDGSGLIMVVGDGTVRLWGMP